MRKTPVAAPAPELAEWEALEGAAVAGGGEDAYSWLQTNYDTEFEVLPAAVLPSEH
jgi:hypothetical protein